MIVSSSPLRVSLFGGSTDNPVFIDRYGHGAVISFPCDLKTYTSISQDKLGSNNYRHNYVINYSRREEVSAMEDIQNELVKLVIEHFDLPPISISLTSDVYSQGSGLASSSSYLISLIKSACIFTGKSMTDHQICDLALKLERVINPNCGSQDPFGCGVGGFKRMDFYRGGEVSYQFISDSIFDMYDMHLVFTGITRNSKNVLDEISKNVDRAKPLLNTVEEAHLAINEGRHKDFIELVNLGWKQKKSVSPMITENDDIKVIDSRLESESNVLAHKLCGAGNGGFFLTFSEKNTIPDSEKYVKISVSHDGVKGISV